MQICRLHLYNHPHRVILVKPQGFLWLYEFLVTYLRGYRPHRLLFSRHLWMRKNFYSHKNPILRDRQVVRHRAHNSDTGGSSPPPAND